MAADPWGARLVFYVVGDTKACTRFLVLAVVLLAAITVVATVSPTAATALASIVTAAAGLASGRRALTGWRIARAASRSSSRAGGVPPERDVRLLPKQDAPSSQSYG